MFKILNLEFYTIKVNYKKQVMSRDILKHVCLTMTYCIQFGAIELEDILE